MYRENLNPKDALERAKLLMNYDTSKTLTENQERNKKGLITEWVWFTAAAIGALSGWIYNSYRAGSAPDKVKTFFDGCSTLMSKMKPTANGGHRAAADEIFDAIDGPGTDENAIRDALASMKTPADLCELKRVYDFKYGDLYEDIDDDIDGADWVSYVWAPIADIIDANPLPEEQTPTPVPTDDNKKTDDNKPKPKPKTGTKYTDCSGTYTQNCKSPKIAEVQRCLGGLKDDGIFGPKTQAALSAKGFPNGFTDADVDKICNKTPASTPDENPDVAKADGTQDDF